MYMGERMRFNSKDSAESRSHSFDSRSDSFDSSHITDISNGNACYNNKTNTIVIPIKVKVNKIRKRDQSLSKPISPSPIPDKSLYLFNQYINDNKNRK